MVVTDLRVATFNIRNGRAFDGWNSWPLRAASTAATLARLDADVIGLQEVFSFQMRSLRRRVPGYQDRGAGRTNGRRGERCPILVRAGAARMLQHRTQWFGDQPDQPGSRLPGASFPRIATTCRLELSPRPAGGSTVVEFTSTHFDERVHEHRELSARQLLARLDLDLPQIVVGDLNADPDDPLLRTLETGGLRQTLPPSAGGTSHRFTGRTDGRRIDHVLVSRHFDVVGAEVSYERVGRRLPSDHWPVIVDLRLADHVDGPQEAGPPGDDPTNERGTIR